MSVELRIDHHCFYDFYRYIEITWLFELVLH